MRWKRKMRRKRRVIRKRRVMSGKNAEKDDGRK
jgi:hypothetical protein